MLIVHFEYLFPHLKRTFRIINVFLTLFNNVHCLKLNSNLGVSQQPLTAHFALTPGVALLVRLRFSHGEATFLEVVS